MPSLSVDSKKFYAALSIVKSVVKDSNPIPILKNVKLETDGSRLQITATDLDIETTCYVDIIEQDGDISITLNASKLSNMVQRFSQEITLLVESDNKITIKSGRTVAVIQTLPSTDYPSISPTDFDITSKLPATSLARALKTVQPFISNDESRHYLLGVYFHTINKTLTCTATNGHFLGMAGLDILPSEFENFEGVIIPKLSIGVFLKALEKTDKEIIIKINARMIVLEIGDITITSKLIDGTYPDVNRLVSDELTHQFEVLKSNLENLAASTAAITAVRDNKVLLTFDKDEICAELTDDSDGQVTDYAPATKIAGEGALVIGVAVQYLATVANSINCKNPIVHLNRTLDKIVFMDNLHGDQFLIMSRRM